MAKKSITQFFLSLFFTLTALYVQGQQDIMLLKTTGKVVIGDTSVISTPGPYNLYVQRGVLTEKVKVAIKNTSEWSDDAWSHTPTLKDVKENIDNKSHLPNMPSATDLVSNGYEVTSMDAKLLAQIEWLWQHMITLSEENENLRKEVARLQSDVYLKSE